MDNYKEETIDSYNKNAEAFSEKFKKLFDLNRRKEFPIFIKLLSGKRVLDLGCGSGDHSYYFSQQGFDIVGVDISSEMIKLCKKKD